MAETFIKVEDDEKTEQLEFELKREIAEDFNLAFELFSRLGDRTSDIQRIEHEQRLLAIGSKILPIIQELIGDNRTKAFYFVKFVEELAEAKDLPDIITMLDLKAVKDTVDNSCTHTICDIIVRIITKARKCNDGEVNAGEIFQALLGKANDPNRSHYANHYIDCAIAATGTEEARRYLDQRDVSGVADVKRILLWTPDSDEVLIYRTSLFRTVAEYNNLHATPSHGHQEIYDYDIDDYANNTFSDDRADRINVVDDRSESRWRAVERLSESETVVIANRAIGIVRSIPDLTQTAAEFARIHLLNYLVCNSNATDEEINLEVAKIIALSEEEQQFKESDLATIGLELEVPDEMNALMARSILSMIGIGHYEEIDSLFELNTSPSYGPWIQARMLHEFALLGVVPLEPIDREKPEDSLWNQRIKREVPLSMHINFGVPESTTGADISSEQNLLMRLNDVLTLAYTSSDRIETRKTSTAFTWQKTSNKVKEDRYADPDKVFDGGLPLRIELRAGEFRDITTYRLLIDAQNLVSLFIAYLQEQNGIRQNVDNDGGISQLMLAFDTETKALLNKYGYQPGMIDTGNNYIVNEMLETTDIQMKCRGLVRKYSRKAREMLHKQPAVV